MHPRFAVAVLTKCSRSGDRGIGVARCRWLVAFLSAALVSAALALPAAAQESRPAVRGLLTGYGAIGYSAVPNGDLRNDFTATLSPVTLFRIGSDILVEGEIELELEGGGTDVHLEHVEVDYQGFERVQLEAGMFHLPFGLWMHSNWVNRMPTPPLLYQDTHGAPPSGALLPILFDVGVMGRANVPLFDGWRTTAVVWVSQGPVPGAPGDHIHAAGGDGGVVFADPAGNGDGHTHDDDPAPAAPRLGIGANFEDNNSDKMVGFRMRAMSAGGLTLHAAGFRARYDDAGDLGVRGLNLSGAWTPGSGPEPLFDLRGEWVLLDQEFLDHGAVESVDYGGYYVQLSRRIEDFEPVLRWSHLPRSVAGEGVLVPKRRQLAVGLTYWIAPSVPVKAAYHVEPDGDDGFFMEWAVGF